jgi:two-component system, chemotaxis family, CheB/CheR fusion protein
MSEPDQAQLSSLLEYLKEKRGFDFSGYKTGSLVRRIMKQMDRVGVHSYSDYIDYLEVHPDEFNRLFDTILINVTSFFRDPPAWDHLREVILPKIIASKKPGDSIRIWSTGCAAGQESYSIAMLFNEALGEDLYRERVKIYATDVDEDDLSKARQAAYTRQQVEGVPEHLLEKYFYECNGQFCIIKDLRRSMVFGRNDLVMDAPISRLDLLICRNTLIYFNAELQKKILSRFHFALNDDGFLFLGKSEMLLTQPNLFTPANTKLRFFSKNTNQRIYGRGRVETGKTGERASDQSSLFLLIEGALEGAPFPQLLLDPNNILVYTNDQARQLLTLSRNDNGKPFQDLTISYRPVELRSYLERARSEGVPVVLRNVEISHPSGLSRFYDVRIQSLGDFGSSISFIDVTIHKNLQDQVEQANHALETAMEELQSTTEELETTNEELQSTIEELETTNEELQATNEELETINEELQSTNEELQTLNDELNLRSEEINHLNRFLESILSSIRSAVLVLDRDLLVTVWNKQSEDYWGLREEEVKGRNILSLDFGLPVERLKKPLNDCLKEKSKQELMVEMTNLRGQKLNCRIICSPLITKDHNLQGVIAMIDEIESDGKVV